MRSFQTLIAVVVLVTTGCPIPPERPPLEPIEDTPPSAIVPPVESPTNQPQIDSQSVKPMRVNVREQRRKLLGKTRLEVREALGSPTSQTVRPDFTETWGYKDKFIDPGSNVYVPNVRIEFNKDGKVESMTW